MNRMGLWVFLVLWPVSTLAFSTQDTREYRYDSELKEVIEAILNVIHELSQYGQLTNPQQAIILTAGSILTIPGKVEQSDYFFQGGVVGANASGLGFSVIVTKVSTIMGKRIHSGFKVSVHEGFLPPQGCSIDPHSLQVAEVLFNSLSELSWMDDGNTELVIKEADHSENSLGETLEIRGTRQLGADMTFGDFQLILSPIAPVRLEEKPLSYIRRYEEPIEEDKLP